MKIGDTVTWESQAAGSWKRKTGVILGFAKPEEEAKRYVPKDDRHTNKVKFQNRSSIERAVVKVPRGGKSILSDYYAPRVSVLAEVLPL